MTFYSSVIKENKSNQAILFTAVDNMLNRLAPKELPQDDNAADLANKIAEFFVHKVKTISNSLNSPGFYPNDEKVVCPATNELHSFTLTSVSEL